MPEGDAIRRLASTLNELAAQSSVDFIVEEGAVPVKDAVL